MAFVSPRMSLKVWNAPSDPYDHEQLADNFLKLDMHDHSPGRGTIISSTGIANGAITSAHLAPGIDPISSYTTYKALRHGIAQLPAASVAQAYILGTWLPSAIPLTGATAPNSVFYIDPTDYAVTNRTTYFRIRSTILVSSATAPGGGFSVALQQITSTSGTSLSGIGPMLGVASTTAPAGNTLNQASGADFTLSAGYYTFVVVPAVAIAAGSSVACRADLSVRQV
jgi:hypothetical protein